MPIKSGSDKEISGFGIVAFILGILAILICWIPLLNLLVLPLGLIGGLVGSIGLAIALLGRKTGSTWSVAGLLLNGCAVILMFTVNAFLTHRIEEISRNLEKSHPPVEVRPPQPPDPPTLPVPTLDPAPPPLVRSVDPFPIAARVEIIGRVLSDTPEDLASYRARGNKMGGGFTPGQEYFLAKSGALALVVARQGDDVQVKLLEKEWKDRLGWIDLSGLRLVPSQEQLGGQVVDGLSLGQRREIYVALCEAETLSTQKADRRAPFPDASLPPQAYQKALKKRQSEYAAIKADLLKSVCERYGIDQARLEAIDQEGIQEKWPTQTLGK